MFGRKKQTVRDVAFVQSAKHLPGPAERSLVRINTLNRLRTSLDISFWLEIAQTFKETLRDDMKWLSIWTAVTILAAAIGFYFLQNKLPMTHAGLIGAAAFLVVTAVAWRIYFVITGQIRRRYAHQGDKRQGSKTLSLNFRQADKVTTRSADILKARLRPRAVEGIESIIGDRVAPYRVIRNVLPVSPLFFRRPRRQYAEVIDASDRRYVKYRLVVDMSDAICAGILGMLGARPRLRYGEETDMPLAKDRYWRADVQEIHDTGQGDVFMRFHQSTVEAEFPPTMNSYDACIYKTYAAMGNFRSSPLFLLRVKDVVDVLLCRHEQFSEAQQQQIYADLSVTPQEAFDLLRSGKFAKQSARADRFKYETTTEPIGRPILEYGEDEDDIIMSFDAGRVWPRADAATDYFHAVMALRGAIHLASRSQAIEVALNRRDVLLVDNLRMLIARREDNPTGLSTPIALMRDIVADAFPSLRGRWLRQIYGYPVKAPGQPSASQAELSTGDKAQDGAAGA